jgi:hypothetical protein
VELELTPKQPPAVAGAVAALLAGPKQTSDPWWQAGIDDALGADDGTSAEDPRGRARVVEP